MIPDCVVVSPGKSSVAIITNVWRLPCPYLMRVW
jgi:hypothetical protein